MLNDGLVKLYEIDEEYQCPKYCGTDHIHKTHYDDKNCECYQFCWDYANPELHIGMKSLRNECAIYKARGFKYLYLGHPAEYKSQIDGYELLGPIDDI